MGTRDPRCGHARRPHSQRPASLGEDRQSRGPPLFGVRGCLAGGRASEADVKTAGAATELLRLPWELLHDGEGFLFQGAKPVRVRRRLPNTKVLDVPVVAPPIRILLVTARPRMRPADTLTTAPAPCLWWRRWALPGLVKLHVLNPPTLPALSGELERARRRGALSRGSFDGHGVYSRHVGLGGLCFEHPEDIGKLDERRHLTVFTQDSTEHGTGLGSLFREHRIPIVFLESARPRKPRRLLNPSRPSY